MLRLSLTASDDLDKIHPRCNWHCKDSLTQEQIVMEGISPNTTLENHTI